MNDEIPAQRDLPPGQLQLRTEHLVREVTVWDRAAQRRRRRLALVLVPAVVAVLAVTGFTTYALTREPTHLESVGCFETAELDGNIAVVNADGRDPTAICAELWRQGDMGPGPAPESLAACVLETGAIGVFPSSGEDTCEHLGLADLPPTYAAEAERFAALRDAIAAELGASYGSSERAPKCLREEEARALVRHELAAAGTRTGASRSSGAGSPPRVRAPRWAWGVRRRAEGRHPRPRAGRVAVD
jgi:hypothetical protein